MDDIWNVIIRNVIAALVGSIVIYVRKLCKDLNASFKKVRELEDRVKNLEKG